MALPTNSVCFKVALEILDRQMMEGKHVIGNKYTKAIQRCAEDVIKASLMINPLMFIMTQNFRNAEI